MQGDYTPLKIAITKGHTAVVELLLSRGANVNDIDMVREVCY